VAHSAYKITVPKTVLNKEFYLGLAEKPSAGKRIADALSGDKKARKNIIKVSKGTQRLPDIEVLSCDTDRGRVIIVPALGHLFTLVQNGGGWQYPVYDYKWVPAPESLSSRKVPSKHDLRIEATVEVIRYFVARANELVVMTDYDQEGEVIGGVVFKELSDPEKFQRVKRMRFSSLTKTEIRESFEKIFKRGKTGIDQGLFEKGLMRHYLDWLWGINLSRALMLSLKYTSGRYQTLSTGRVQGPTLSFVAMRQEEIDNFIPTPYFKLYANLKKGRKTYELIFTQQSIESLSVAKGYVEKHIGMKGEVSAIEKSERKVGRPVPYNLSQLQSDAYRYYRFSPRRTLNLAERLYLSAAITYPRTSSEQFPKGTDHQDILKRLGRQKKYHTLANKIIKLGPKRRPNQGKKTDPAHPAISPTGNSTGAMNDDVAKLYDLIVRRYLAIFSHSAVVENHRIEITQGDLNYRLSGNRVKKMGWWEFQAPPGGIKETALPSVKSREKVNITDLEYKEHFTSPPPGYNEASLLKEMEKAEIGTKATRADIIQALIDRKYVEGNPLQITRLGKVIYNVLDDFSPRVLSVELSREVEHLGDLVEKTANKVNGSSLSLSEAVLRGIGLLHSMIYDLQQNEYDIGYEISMQLMMQNKEQSELGECPVCHSGTLKIISSKISGKRFIGCSNYFNGKTCDATFPLPQRGKIESVETPCPVDGFPQIKVFSGRRPWITCINMECESVKERQKQWDENRKRIQELKDKKSSKEGLLDNLKLPKKVATRTAKKPTKSVSSKSTSSKKSSSKNTKKVAPKSASFKKSSTMTSKKLPKKTPAKKVSTKKTATKNLAVKKGSGSTKKTTKKTSVKKY